MLLELVNDRKDDFPTGAATSSGVPAGPHARNHCEFGKHIELVNEGSCITGKLYSAERHLDPRRWWRRCPNRSGRGGRGARSGAPRPAPPRQLGHAAWGSSPHPHPEAPATCRWKGWAHLSAATRCSGQVEVAGRWAHMTQRLDSGCKLSGSNADDQIFGPFTRVVTNTIYAG